VGKKIGLAPFLLSDFFQRLKRWRKEEIREAFRLSLAADSQLKGGRQSPSFVLEALLLELCQLASKGKRGILIPFGN
jgi:DNA polymerase III delta subunit